MAEKIINGRAFKVEKLLATKAVFLKARLMKAIGPAAAELPMILGAARFDKDGKPDPARELPAMRAAIAAFTSIFANNDSAEVAQLVIDIAQIAKIAAEGGNGVYAQVSFDRDFSDGHLSDYVEVVIFVLQEQFADFFSDLLGLSSRVQQNAN